MKQWLTIIMMAFAAAVVQTGAGDHPCVTPNALRPAVLTQQDTQSAQADDAPLLAIPAPAARHAIGAEETAAKKNRPANENPFSALYANSTPGHSRPALFKKQTVSVLPAIMTSGRYIYFLRRIVI